MSKRVSTSNLLEKALGIRGIECNARVHTHALNKNLPEQGAWVERSKSLSVEALGPD